MEEDSSLPFSLVASDALVRLSARIVPKAKRTQWQEQWRAELRHRREFLMYAGEWTPKEAFRFAWRALQAVPDAAAQFLSEETVQHRIHATIRSPWTCLAVLAGLLFALGLLTTGFRATRRGRCSNASWPSVARKARPSRTAAVSRSGAPRRRRGRPDATEPGRKPAPPGRRSPTPDGPAVDWAPC